MRHWWAVLLAVLVVGWGFWMRFGEPEPGESRGDVLDEVRRLLVRIGPEGPLPSGTKLEFWRGGDLEHSAALRRHEFTVALERGQAYSALVSGSSVWPEEYSIDEDTTELVILLKSDLVIRGVVSYEDGSRVEHCAVNCKSSIARTVSVSPTEIGQFSVVLPLSGEWTVTCSDDKGNAVEILWETILRDAENGQVDLAVLLKLTVRDLVVQAKCGEDLVPLRQPGSRIELVRDGKSARVAAAWIDGAGTALTIPAKRRHGADLLRLRLPGFPPTETTLPDPAIGDLVVDLRCDVAVYVSVVPPRPAMGKLWRVAVRQGGAQWEVNVEPGGSATVRAQTRSGLWIAGSASGYDKTYVEVPLNAGRSTEDAWELRPPRLTRHSVTVRVNEETDAVGLYVELFPEEAMRRPRHTGDVVDGECLIEGVHFGSYAVVVRDESRVPWARKERVI